MVLWGQEGITKRQEKTEGDGYAHCLDCANGFMDLYIHVKNYQIVP